MTPSTLPPGCAHYIVLLEDQIQYAQGCLEEITCARMSSASVLRDKAAAAVCELRRMEAARSREPSS